MPILHRPAPRALYRLAVRILTGALALHAAAAGALALPEPVAEALAHARVAPADASFFVQDVAADRPLLELNADRLQNPASVIKTVTTFAALELLGPAYRWNTQLVATAPLDGDVLAGDLHVRASGDPQFVIEDLWMMLRELRARGVRGIAGDLVVDRSIFAPIDHDDARFDGETLRPYNVGPDAFLLNYKATAFRFLPIDGRVAVAMEPGAPGAQPRAELALTDGPCTDWRQRIAADFSDPAHPVFRGEYPRDCGTQTWYVNLFSHDEYVRRAFAQLWTELGGSLRPGFAVRSGPVPEGARVLAEWTSPPLAEEIREINKFSNNVMAQQLFLALAGDGAPRDAARAAGAVSAWLAAKGVDPAGMVIDNGAGLSRSARASARQIGGLLLAAYRSPAMPEFIASLPIVGLDGTMKRRFAGDPLAGRAHIKTGTLNEVRAIAGYLTSASGRRYVVASIVNGARAAAAQPVHDALLAWLYANG